MAISKRKKRLGDEFDFHRFDCNRRCVVSDKVSIGELLDFLDAESAVFEDYYSYEDENVWWTLDKALDRTVAFTDDDYDEEDGILEWEYEKYLWNVGDTPWVDGGYIRIPVQINVVRHVKDYEGDAYGNVDSGHTGWACVKPDADTGFTWEDVLGAAFGFGGDREELDEINEQLMKYHFDFGRGGR